MTSGKLAGQVDGRWNDDQFLEGTNSEVSSEPAYSVWNASFGFTSANDKTRVSVWVKNFTDKQYRIYDLDLDLDLGLLGFIEQAFAPPRQFGLSVSYHWQLRNSRGTGSSGIRESGHGHHAWVVREASSRGSVAEI